MKVADSIEHTVPQVQTVNRSGVYATAVGSSEFRSGQVQRSDSTSGLFFNTMQLMQQRTGCGLRPQQQQQAWSRKRVTAVRAQAHEVPAGTPIDYAWI